jgi:hypothetical protein
MFAPVLIYLMPTGSTAEEMVVLGPDDDEVPGGVSGD